MNCAIKNSTASITRIATALPKEMTPMPNQPLASIFALPFRLIFFIAAFPPTMAIPMIIKAATGHASDSGRFTRK